MKHLIGSIPMKKQYCRSGIIKHCNNPQPWSWLRMFGCSYGSHNISQFSIYIYICMYVCMYVYIYMSIYKFQLSNDILYSFPMIYIPDTLYPNSLSIWAFPEMGVPLVIIHFKSMSPYKSTILGYPHFRKPHDMLPERSFFPQPVATAETWSFLWWKTARSRYGGFHHWRLQNGWLIRENTIKINDLGVPPTLGNHHMILIAMLVVFSSTKKIERCRQVVPGW